MRSRHFLALGLIFSLVLTSQAMANLRAAPAPANAVVLCIGGAAVLVRVDADGQPVATPHFCPDCAIHAVPLPTGAHEFGTPIPREIGPVTITLGIPVLPVRPDLPPSRAPPPLV